MSPIQKQVMILVMIFTTLFMGCGGSKEEEARNAILKGDTFYQNDLFTEALTYYEGALEVLPTDAQLHLRIGMCRQNLGKPEDAIKSFEIAMRQDATLKEAYQRKAKLLIQVKKVDEAEKFAEEVIARDGLEGTGFYIRGVVAKANGEVDQAVQHFEKSLELDPEDTATQEALVEAYRDSGQTKPAITLIEKLIEKKPDEVGMVAQLAFLYEAEGNTDKAISLISKLINDHPENGRLRSALARLYLSQSQFDLAEKEASEALTRNPDDPSALYVSGSVAMQKGNLEQAYEDLKAAQERSPTDELIRKAYRDVQMARGQMIDPVNTLKEKIVEEGETVALLIQLADAYLFTGDAATALFEVQKALEKDPENQQGKIVQAHSLMSLGNRQGAQALLETLGESDNPRVLVMKGILSDTPDQVNQGVETLKSSEGTASWGKYFSGVYKLIKGSLESGIKELDEAFESDESFGMPMDELGRLYIALNEPGIAVNIYNRLMLRFPDSPRPPMMIARLLDQAGKTDRAMIVLDGLIEKLPDFQPAKFFLATLYIKNQDFQKAKDLVQALIDQSPEDPASQLIYRGILAKTHLFAQEYGFAIEQYDKILEVKPDFPIALVEKSLAQMANDQPGPALESSSAALASATEKTIPHIVHSILLQQNGQVVEGLKELEEVERTVDAEAGKKEDLIPLLASLKITAGEFDGARTTVNGSNRPQVMKDIFLAAIDEAQNNRVDLGAMSMGYLFGYYSWPDPAITIHRRLLEKYPKIALLTANLGEILQQARRDQEAYEVYAKALEWAPDNSYFLRTRAKLASRLGNLEVAMEDLLKVLGSDPNDPGLLFQLGTVYEKQNLISDAIGAYERVIGMNPGNQLGAASANNLAWLYSQNEGQLDLALQNAEKALELSPAHPRTGWKDGNILDTAGWIQYKKGNLDEALKNIDQALKTLPYHPTIIYHMARVYEDKSEPRVAIHLYQKALAFSEEFDEAGDARQRLQTLVIQEREKEAAKEGEAEPEAEPTAQP